MKQTAILHNVQQAHAVVMAFWESAKQRLQGGQKLVLELREQKRTLAQNAALHAALTDVSLQYEWAGRKWDIEDWKRFMTAAWCRATNQAAVIVPAIDGHGFDVLYRRTSELDKSECSELLEYVHAWGAEHGVRFSAPKSWEQA